MLSIIAPPAGFVAVRFGRQDKVGKVTRKQVLEIVKMKLKDLNATDEEAAFRVVAGTARSMGIEIAG